MKISIVIPTYNNPTLLDFVLSNLRNTGNIPDELIVISDYSETQNIDETVYKKHAIFLNASKFLKMPTWSGYAKTINRAIRESSGEVVLLLNTDVTLLSFCLATIRSEFCKDPKLAVLGAKLFFPDGKVQHSGGYYVWGSDFVNYNYGRNDWEIGLTDRRFYPDELQGSAYAFRRSIYDEIGGFDEKYKFWYEDPEFCYQSWERGYKVLYNPEIKAIHVSGGSRGREPKFDLLHIQSRKIWEKRALTRNWNKIYRNVYEANKLDIGTDSGQILIDRMGEIGDVIKLTETIHKIKESYPGHEILVRTNFPHVFNGNPDVSDAGMVEAPYALHVDFNVSHEMHLDCPMSVGHAMVSKEAGLSIFDNTVKPMLFSDESDRMSLSKKINLPKSYAVIHEPITHWRSKTMTGEFWAEIECHLHDRGITPIIVGSKKDMGPRLGKSVDFRVKTTLAELRELIIGARVFVGQVSAPLHVCQSTDTPGVAVCTSESGWYTVTAENVISVEPQNGLCRGCLHRQPMPCGMIDCPDHKDHECAKKFDPKRVIEAIDKQLEF